MSARAKSVDVGDTHALLTSGPAAVAPVAGGEAGAGGDRRVGAHRSGAPGQRISAARFSRRLGLAALVTAIAVGVAVVVGTMLTGAPAGGERTWWSGLGGALSTGQQLLTSPQWVAALLADASWSAPVVFVAGFVVVTSLGVPRTVLTIAAGWVFGVGAGMLLAWGASVTAAWVGYEMARLVAAARTGARHPPTAGRPWGGLGGLSGPDRQSRPGRSDWPARVGRARGRWGEAVAARAGDRRAVAVAVVSARLVPVLPFAVVNYACGGARLSRPAFVLGSAAGLLPGAAVYAVLGAGLAVPGWVQLATVTTGAVAAVAAAGAAVVRRRRPGLNRTRRR